MIIYFIYNYYINIKGLYNLYILCINKITNKTNKKYRMKQII